MTSGAKIKERKNITNPICKCFTFRTPKYLYPDVLNHNWDRQLNVPYRLPQDPYSMEI